MYYRGDNRVRNAAIAGIVVLLLIGGYFTFFHSSDPADEIKDMRVRLIEQYEGVLAIDPGNIDITYKIAELYKSLGDIDKAIRYYKKVLELDPVNYPALIGLGHAYALNGDYDKAIEIYERAKKNKPKNIKNIFFISSLFFLVRYSFFEVFVIKFHKVICRIAKIVKV